MTPGICAGVNYRHSFVLVMFIVLQIMFSAINLQHLNMEHSEAVRECQIPQAHKAIHFA